MTGQQTRFEHHSRSASRRPGIIPGRRFALVLAVAGVLLAAWGDVAAGDDSVVSATVYGGSNGGVTNSTVSLTTLNNNCTTSSTNPINLYPGPSTFQPTPASWALGTVVTCGLRIPKPNIASVQVYDTNGAPESPLTNAQLSDPGQWPSGGGALPLISTEAAEDLNTYVRPWEGNDDKNAADEVVASGTPIAIVVTETGSVLNVNASSQQQSSTTFSFSATATRPDGTAVPAADLSYSWNFGDGSASTSPTPTHTFSQAGAYPIVVQVTDAAAGMDGDGHTNVTVGSSAAPGSRTPHTGASKGNGKSPNGPSHTTGSKSGAKPGKSSSSSGKGHTGTQATNASGTSASTGSPPSSSPPGKSTGRARTNSHHHAAPSKRRPTPTTGPAVAVSGRLISDIALLPAATSPLVHAVPASAATAPPVRRAVSASTSPWAALAAGLGVLLLFGLGARRELRWRRAWRLAHLNR